MMKNRIITAILACITFFSFQPIKQPTSTFQSYVPFYSQRDSGWNEEPLGEPVDGKYLPEQTIGNWGCGVTTSAMVISYYGKKMTPLELNNALVNAEVEISKNYKNNGFSGANLYWANTEAWSEATGDLVKGISITDFDEEELKANLSHGRPIIVFINNTKTTKDSTDGHYVLIVDMEETTNSQTGKKTTKYKINDPWLTEENGFYIDYEKNALGLPLSNLTQMIVIHTDQIMPVDGPLVDWPAIQDKFIDLGGMEGWLNKPTKDDSYTTDPMGFIKIHTQEFEGGKIYTYKIGTDDEQVFALNQEMANFYDQHDGLLGDFGRIVFDPYEMTITEITTVKRLDMQNVSLFAYPNGRMETYTSENGVKAEYYNNEQLFGAPIVTRFEPSIQFTWGKNSPHPAIQPDSFSVRFTQTIHFDLPGLKTIFILPMGGVRVFVDEIKVLDRWEQDNTDCKISTNRWLSRGDHKLVIEYRHGQGDASIWSGETSWPAKIVWADTIYSGWGNTSSNAPPLSGTEPVESEPVSLCPESLTIIDDQFPSFIRYEVAPGWKEVKSGYQDHFYWATTQPGGDRTGTWILSIPKEGIYRIYVYIPSNHTSARNVTYIILHANQQDTVTISQADHRNEWFRLGEYTFSGEGEEYIRLSNASTDEVGEVAYDAVGFILDSENLTKRPFWNNIIEKFQKWWKQQSEQLQKEFIDWLSHQMEQIERNFKVWLQELWVDFLDWLEKTLAQWLQQICGSAYLVVIVPAISIITLQNRQRYKNK